MVNYKNLLAWGAVLVASAAVPSVQAAEAGGRLVQSISVKNSIENAETRAAVEALLNSINSRLAAAEAHLAAVQNCQSQLMFYNGVICTPQTYVENSGNALRAQVASQADSAAYAAAATWATTAGLANQASTAGSAQVANWANSANSASWAADAARATASSSADYANSANVSNYSGSSGYATSAGSANSAGYAGTAGTASYAHNAGFAQGAQNANWAAAANTANYAHSANAAKKVPVLYENVRVGIFDGGVKGAHYDLCVLKQVESWAGPFWGACIVNGSAGYWEITAHVYNSFLSCEMACYNFQ